VLVERGSHETPGITPDMEKKLRSRKNGESLSEHERWVEIYRLIFPNEMGLESISPCKYMITNGMS
jgi:hypothetical protein